MKCMTYRITVKDEDLAYTDSQYNLVGLMRVNLAYATDYSINTLRVLIAHYSWDLCPPVFNLSPELSVIDYFSELISLISSQPIG